MRMIKITTLEDYKFLKEDRTRGINTIVMKGTEITLEEVIEGLGLVDKDYKIKKIKITDSDIKKLINDPKYSGLKKGHVLEVLTYFRENEYEAHRRVIEKRLLAEARPGIQRLLEAERLTAEDYMVTINTRA